MPTTPSVVPPATLESIAAELDALQPSIGRYPPRFKDEDDREQIYRRWAAALVGAQGLDDRGDLLHAKLYLLSELYRQGHNLDVLGAAPQAMETVEHCIQLYPRSRLCHLSASYFYLSTTGIPSRLDRAERSLVVVRDIAAPQLDDDAEAGLIWVALYRGEGAEATRRIDQYLAEFPQSSRAEMFRKIRNGGKVTLKERPGP